MRTLRLKNTLRGTVLLQEFIELKLGKEEGVETSHGNSVPCQFTKENTIRTTINDWEVSYVQTDKLPQTTQNVAQ